MYKAQNLVHREAIVSVYTHARTHACMRARARTHTHTHTHTRTHTQSYYTTIQNSVYRQLKKTGSKQSVTLRYLTDVHQSPCSASTSTSF